MKLRSLTACLTAFVVGSHSIAAAPVNYFITNIKATTTITIQTVSLNAVPEMNSQAVGKVNKKLKTTSAEWLKESKECGSYAEGHPWGYSMKVSKVLHSKDYLSVVFDKFTVCAGSPDIEKKALTFSVHNGDFLPPQTLLKKLAPYFKYSPSISSDKELIEPDKIMIEKMFKDSQVTPGLNDNGCDFYLKTTSYHIWPENKNLVLFPEFRQTDSSCQKEYIIQISN